MENMKTAQEIAQEALKYFTTGKRDNGEEFVKTIDDRPEWLHDLIFAAHGDMMPDDWRYKFIEESLEYISEHEEIEYPEDMEPDIYTSDLTSWLNSRNDRVYYLTEVLEEFEIKDGFQALQVAQMKEKEEVYLSVLSSLQGLIEEQEEEEE